MTVTTNNQTNTYYYLKDHQNSVIALTDTNGQIVEAYSYDAYGRTRIYATNGTELTRSAVGNRFAWQGREVDWSTGLYYFRARYYDPIMGRWLSVDPIGISGGLNLYEFCGSDPINMVDPDGENAIEAYDYWSDVAVSGFDQGGFGGYAQAAGASLMQAFIDFWGARSLENNASLSGQYSTSDECQGKAWKHGLYAAGQVALSAASAFGGNNAVHPYFRYVGAGSRPIGKGAWLVRGTLGRGAPYGRNFAQAANKLQIPPQSMINDVVRVPGTWKTFVGGPRRVTGNPQWGAGGGTEYRMGMHLWP